MTTNAQMGAERAVQDVVARYLSHGWVARELVQADGRGRVCAPLLHREGFRRYPLWRDGRLLYVSVPE